MMVKELEKRGLAVAHITCMTSIALGIGSNRVVGGYSVHSTMCDCNSTPEKQYEQRYELMKKTLDALCTDIKDKTLF